MRAAGPGACQLPCLPPPHDAMKLPAKNGFTLLEILVSLSIVTGLCVCVGTAALCGHRSGRIENRIT